MSSPDLLLASQSPRRRELLTQIGVRYELVKIDVPEVQIEGELPAAYVSRLAREKALTGFDLQPLCFQSPSNEAGDQRKPVLGADTIVVLGETVLEKPVDQAHAAALLASLSGKTHEVLTAVAICSGEGVEEVLCSTWVSFRDVCDDERAAYWQSAEPKDKAGGYGIQGFGAVFIKRIEGSYSNVVGLPLYETGLMLKKLGIPFWSSYIE